MMPDFCIHQTMAPLPIVGQFVAVCLRDGQVCRGFDCIWYQLDDEEDAR